MRLIQETESDSNAERVRQMDLIDNGMGMFTIFEWVAIRGFDDSVGTLADIAAKAAKDAKQDDAIPVDCQIGRVFLLPMTAWDKAAFGEEITRETLHEGPDLADLTQRLWAHTEVDHWIRERAKSPAIQWIVQALADAPEASGLTSAEVHELVKGRLGEMRRQTWHDAWNKVTDGAGPWSHVVREVGKGRWTAVAPTP